MLLQISTLLQWMEFYVRHLHVSKICLCVCHSVCNLWIREAFLPDTARLKAFLGVKDKNYIYQNLLPCLCFLQGTTLVYLGLLVLESFPLLIIIAGLFTNGLYFLLLKDFPFIQLTSPVFLGGVGKLCYRKIQNLYQSFIIAKTCA